MLCTLLEEPFDSEDWLFEPKLDGLRVLCEVKGGRVRLLSRNGKAQAFQFPDIVAGLKEACRAADSRFVVDGEIVCLNERGVSSFKALQQRFHLQNKTVIERRARAYPAYLYVFDLLELGKRDLTGQPLRERKRALSKALRWNDRIRLVEGTPARGTALFSSMCAASGEGVIGKRLSSPYVGNRTGDWVKIKCITRQEFVVGGYTEPQGSRVGLGALLVGYYGDDGRELIYCGKVGTGFNKEVLLELRDELEKLEQRQPAFTKGDAPRDECVHWVKPKLVAEIAFAEWTRHGILRQPRFEGLREDKIARDVRREQPKQRKPTPMKLSDYRQKRDFKITSEPRAKVKKASKKPIFVVQEHHASRLHYDFRLEAGGVLKSWAVTKEPTLDPSIKRLAVEVEDHPVDYASFHGDIPEGEYGAGHVEIWDKGTFESERDVLEAVERGKLEFTLKGKKLKGKFALIRMKGGGKRHNWLLIKMKEKAMEKTERGKIVPISSRLFKFSNLDKIMYPDVGVTKGEVLSYYERVAPLIIPELRDRPITVERLPNGLGGTRFWQKNTPDYYPDWVPRVCLPSETGKPVQYALVNDANTLLYFVNQGTLTFHTFLSRVENLNCPDFVLFDLDPGEASFKSVVTVARHLHDVFDDLGIESAVKTSGKSGLHVCVSWPPTNKIVGDYEEARQWALGIARRVVAECPKLATIERTKAKRDGKIYVDVMQNAMGHHAVPPYVLRATPGATISTPLDWDEVNAKLDPRDFNIRTAFLKKAA